MKYKAAEMKFEFEIGNDEIISTGGLEIVGQLLKMTQLKRVLDALGTKRYVISTYSVIMAYIGLLAQGKNAYEDVREFEDSAAIYAGMLGIDAIPSCETLRQRLDEVVSAGLKRPETAETKCPAVAETDVRVLGTRPHMGARSLPKRGVYAPSERARVRARFFLPILGVCCIITDEVRVAW